MNGLSDQQIEYNTASRNAWVAFHTHRDRVTDLLLHGTPVPASSRLCVLGAGNCNDLDLPALLAAYREVHLVDLDGEAVVQGMARQGVTGHTAIHCHGGIDLTGVLDELAGWSPSTAIRDEDLAACATAPLRRVRPALPGSFDLVASTCLLSQIVGFVVRTAGERHPRFLAALQAVRAGHLRLLADLVAPGGVGVLISDLVSSDSFPSLALVPDAQLPALVAQLVREYNFFHGVNPAVIASFLRSDPGVAPQVTGLEFVGPWLWDLGPRVYLVYACKFSRRATPAVS